MKGGFEKLPEGYFKHLKANLRVAKGKRSGKPGALKHDIRRFMHALHGVIPHKLTTHESYGPLRKHSSFADGFVDELAKIAGKDLPEINQWLSEMQDDAKQKGYNVFAVAEDPSKRTGASITQVKGSKKGAVRHARKSHTQWERKFGFDPHHDWRKKIAKIVGTPSQQRLDRSGFGPIESGGIHRGDMYGESPLLPQREPSPVKPLEKRRRRAHPKR